MRRFAFWISLGLLGWACNQYPSRPQENHPPVIIRLDAQREGVPPGGRVALMVETEDPDGDSLTYQWTVPFGNIEEGFFYRAPLHPPDTIVFLHLEVLDGRGGKAKDSLSLLTNLSNAFPVVDSLVASKETLNLASPDSAILRVYAWDPDGDHLVYHWSSHTAYGGPTPYAYIRVEDSVAVYYPGPCCVTPVYVVVKVQDSWGTTDRDSVLLHFQ